ncbi:MAG: S66 peptidase family protein [Myxococcota bacterium]
MPTVRCLSPRRLVRVVGPSSPFTRDRLSRGLDCLTSLGFRVEGAEQVLREGHGYLNGDDEERRRELQEALDSDADVVWLARGGYGLTRLLSTLTLPASVPMVVGFSDATALHAWAWQLGVHTVHGPLLTTLADEPPASIQRLLDVLAGKAAGSAHGPLTELVEGDRADVEGRLFAGNLCVLTHLIGTPAWPDLRGAIVVLEEVGERPYRVDRMLTQLLSSGSLAQVAAVVLGHLTRCDEPPGGTRPVPSAAEVFAERLRILGVPVLAGLSSGHEAPNHPLIVGGRARLVRQGSTWSLQVLEEVSGMGLGNQ